MVDYEAGGTPMSMPATPGTPTPLMPSSLRVDSMSYDRKSMPRCKCLPVDAPTWGAPHTCLADFSVPDISLTRKVLYYYSINSFIHYYYQLLINFLF